MGLENFITDEDDSSNADELDDDSNLWEERAEQMGIQGRLDGLEHTQSGHETDEHYNTKFRIAIKLAKVGYEVTIEKTIGDADIDCDCEDEDITPDIIAKESDSVLDFNKLVPSETFTVEVGGFDPGRAKKQLELFNSIVWVRKDDKISDGMVISEVSNARLNKNAVKDEEYIDSSGNVVDPEIGNLVTEKSREIALQVLLKISDFSEKSVKEVTDEVNSERPTGYEYRAKDVRRVLSELDVIE